MATKKPVKKVEAQIDQHETFVSLQKNFADSEMSVEEKLKTLYELQKADSEMDKIVLLRGELPAEVEALENEIADLKGRSAQLSAVIAGCAGGTYTNVVEAAHADARAIAGEDPDLGSDTHRPLAAEVRSRFSAYFDEVVRS